MAQESFQSLFFVSASQDIHCDLGSQGAKISTAADAVVRGDAQMKDNYVSSLFD